MKEPSQRVKDILANMSIEQKAAQLSCVIPSLVLEKGEFKEERALKEMPFGVGRMTQFASGFTQGPVQAATGYNAIQKYMIEKTGYLRLFKMKVLLERLRHKERYFQFLLH